MYDFSRFQPRLPSSRQTFFGVRRPLFLGDMNAKSPLWWIEGCKVHINGRGRVFEEMLMEINVSQLNNRKPTHYHIQLIHIQIS